MDKNTSISPDDHCEIFVDEHDKERRYSSASDAIRAALVKGEKSGIAEDYDIGAIQRELDKEK